MKSALVAAIGVCGLTVLLSAQEPRFEAASVKPNVGGATSMLWSYRGRRFTARYATLKSLIGTAYGAEEATLLPLQLIGGPRWIDSERFDVIATAPDVPDSPRGTFPAAMLTKLRTLLEERFQLRTHFETRDLPVFALVLARSDGTLGPALRQRTADCISGATTPERRNLFDSSITDRSRCHGRVEPGLLTGNGLTMNNLAQGLGRLVPGIDRVVVDRTGLKGTYDVDLTWNFEGTADHLGVPLPQPNRDAPTLFVALQEQLGLKLESTKGPVDVLVIDHAERPAPD